ncbi:hypothetical protein [Actinoplanes sp. NPDC051494]|uniref:hypothetical protein n=1 Tax=Actinoplanes sp. NPDC051494 TaxID=3363907 RepID=UPI00378990C7
MKAHLGAAAGRVPARGIPNVVVRLAALVDPEFRALVPDLGYVKKPSSDKARTVLGWTPRDVDSAILAAAGSMIAKGLVRK